jgi:hypothetical protein
MIGQAYFQGKYIEDMAGMYAAAIVAKLNGIAVGAPGYGKTDVAESMCIDIFGDGNFGFFRIDPSTMPEELKGAVDIERLLSNDPAFQRKVKGSMFDADLHAHIVDEIGRGSGVILNILLLALNRKDVLDPAPVLATSNFMPKGVEFEALLDRFALWKWVAPTNDLDTSAMVRAQLLGLGGRLHVEMTLPALTDLQDVWAARPGDKAADAIVDVIGSLETEIANEGLMANPRRRTAWSRLLYRMGVYYTGSADFTALPNEAVHALRWAWPAKTEAEATTWQTLVGGLVDPIQTLIDNAMAEVAKAANEAIGDLESGKRQIAEAANVVAQAVMKFERDAMALGVNDPRVNEAKGIMMGWTANVVRKERIAR